MEKKHVTPPSAEEMDAVLQTLGRQAKVGAIIGIAGLVVALLYFAVWHWALLLLGIVVSAGGFIYRGVGLTKMKNLAAAQLIPQTLSQVLENVKYDPRGRMDNSVVRVEMGFPFDFDEIRGSDRIAGTYRGLKMEMSDLELVDVRVVHTKNGSHTERVTVFKGQWITCQFHRKLSADVLLSERGALGQMMKLGGIKTESEAFNKRFCIRSDSEHDVFYLLTPHRMEQVLAMDALACGNSYLRFGRDGLVHIAIDTGKNLFEVGRERSAAALRNKFLQEIRHITALLDTLCLAED